MYLYSAAAGEERGDREACQSLANLCVLLNYDTSSPACAMYKKLTSQFKSITNGEAEWWARWMEIFDPFVDPISLGDWINERIENLHSSP